MHEFPRRDLEEILSTTESLWREARRARIFLTGGTGFIGSWLAQSFAHVNSRLSLGASLVILTRGRLEPMVPAVEYCRGDLAGFDFPPGSFSHIIHAANPGESSPDFISTVVSGAARVVEFSRTSGAHRLLFLSSGAVYGTQPAALGPISEDREMNESEPPSEYTASKRAAEKLCLEAHATIARCFAFIGPGLPQNGKFAAGNFIQNFLRHEPIQVNGDGTAVRSYLYAADLAAWLWTLLFAAMPATIYNVGSDQPVCIRELATRIANRAQPPLPVRIERRAGAGASWYVP